MKLTIRPLTSEDVAAVYTIERSSFPRPWTRDIFEELGRMRGYTLLRSSERLVALVAQVDRQVVGFIIWEDSPSQHRGRILNIAVDKSFRRRGIGERLMRHALEDMRAIGVVTCELEVRESNSAARLLYAKMGMVPCDRIPLYYGDEDAIRYRITLPSSQG